MNTKKIILMSGLLAVVLGVTGFRLDAACAQQRPGGHNGPPPGQRGPGGPGGPRGEEHMFERLNLTDEQKQKIETLREKQHDDAEQFHQQMQGIGEQMRAIVESRNFDEAAARALLTKEAQIEVELKLLRIRTDNAILNLLTAEQRTKLDDLRRNQRRPGYNN
ncbi:MAG: Spy/CpxP family protein refolding chaperone [Blastocatellia bacterium]